LSSHSVHALDHRAVVDAIIGHGGLLPHKDDSEAVGPSRVIVAVLGLDAKLLLIRDDPLT
jgi:hypothetical protein